ncbi:MAG: hypothetical protein WDA16_12360, partial [Candidatus Thermoplasmatota archaeon]
LVREGAKNAKAGFGFFARFAASRTRNTAGRNHLTSNREASVRDPVAGFGPNRLRVESPEVARYLFHVIFS